MERFFVVLNVSDYVLLGNVDVSDGFIFVRVS
jgi:hypothetical protein